MKTKEVTKSMRDIVLRYLSDTLDNYRAKVDGGYTPDSDDLRYSKQTEETIDWLEDHEEFDLRECPTRVLETVKGAAIILGAAVLEGD